MVQEVGGLVIYGSNHFPGPEILLDWSSGFLTRRDLVHALKSEGINPAHIMDQLVQ
jgi:hypothetical protein